MTALLPDKPTGQQLVDAIHDLARSCGATPQRVAKALSSDPNKWLKQVAIAHSPKAHTIARVGALLAGKAVVPPPLNSFQAKPAAQSYLRVRVSPPSEILAAPVRRDPCFRCGVRADVGCVHQRIPSQAGSTTTESTDNG